MRKLLAALFSYCLLGATPVQAQVGFGGMFPGPGTVHAAGGGGFTGVGDTASAAAYWSASWAYSSATKTSNLIQACDALDAHCVNIPGNSSGILDVASVNVGLVPCNDSTNICTIKTFYDPTGNGHTMTQGTIASRATLLVSCTGLGAGVPCGTATSAVYTDAITTTQAQQYTTLWVANRNSATGSDDMVMGANDFTFKSGYGFFGAANRVTCNAGNDDTVSPVNDGTWNNVACVFNGASSNIKINATDNTGKNLGTNGPSSANLRFFTDGGGGNMKGKIAMGAFFASGISSGNLSTMNTSNHTNGGF